MSLNIVVSRVCVFFFNMRNSFDEIPEANVCNTPEECEIVNPIEFAKHGESPAEMENGFFQRAKELLGMSKV